MAFLCRCIVWMLVAFIACNAGQDTSFQKPLETRPDDALVGLWGVESVFGPEIRGQIIFIRANDRWDVSVGGYKITVSLNGNYLRFKLPGGQGEFRGNLVADETAISGSWIQPPGVWFNNSFATPLKMLRISPNTCAGSVVPLDDQFSLYLQVSRQSDGSLVGVFRNPEAGLTNRARQFQVVADRDKVQFVDPAHPERKLNGIYDAPQKQLTIDSPYLGRALVLTARSRDQAVGFYPRTPAREPYTYRPPVTEDDGWQTAPPSQAGIDEAALTALVRQIERANPLDDEANLIHSVSISRHGKLVLDEYFFGFDKERPHDLRSASKAFASVLLGVAMIQHAPISPETPVYSLFPATSPDPHGDSRKQSITIANLLTHSSGLACNDNDSSSPGQENAMQRHPELDWYRFALDLPVVHAPGETWAYCSGGINLAAGGVRQAVHTWLPEYFDRFVAQPLQFGHYYTQLMPDGEAYMGGGMYLRPRDFLKIGQVYLDGGLWRGRRVVDQAWVEASTVPRIKGFDDLGEGYAWHIYSLKAAGHEYREIEANGTGGQILMIIPELDLSVLFTAGNYNSYPISRKSRNDLVVQILIPGITGK